MGKIERFEEMEIWQQARAVAKEVYAVSSQGGFGRDLGLRSQLQRAAVSIMSNIAEGFERGTNKEFVQFLFIAKGSAGEVRSQLFLALDLGTSRKLCTHRPCRRRERPTGPWARVPLDARPVSEPPPGR
jgi:four helix bundle protein